MGMDDTVPRGRRPEGGQSLYVITLLLWLTWMGLVDHYYYVGMEFHEDPEMRAPVGHTCGDEGMLLSFYCCYFKLFFFKYVMLDI